MPWQKGQSGNPGGLSKGSRRKLSDAFIRVLARDWETHGEQVLRRVRQDNPVAYFKGLLSLLPKDVHLEGELSADTAVPSYPATEAFFQQFLDERDRKLEAEDAEPVDSTVKNKLETMK
jgi:hypothetical protein